MADTSFPVSSGFYDAINHDRTYTADDMNRPYKRVVTDGVFATPAGDPSTDFQVFPGTGTRELIVSAGQGIVFSKWFENPAPITVEVPANNTLYSRIDSVVLRVDVSDAVRAGSIVYRTGTAAASPTPPAINAGGNSAKEYRVANITVSAGASAIAQSNIEDCRGSDECPWVTGVIKQVDTSTLFAQYQNAYREQFDAYDAAYLEYTEHQQQRWDDFMESLTEELSVEMSIVPLKESVVTQAETSTVSVPFAEYDPETDVMDVYVNGLIAVEGVDYTISANGQTATFATALDAGARVDFRLLKSVIASNVDSAMAIVQRMDERVSAFCADTGDLAITLSQGITAVTGKTPKIRAVGGRVYLRGSVKGLTTSGQIGSIPADLVPAADHVFVSAARSSGTVKATLVVTITTTGIISVSAKSATFTNTSEIPLSTAYLAGTLPTLSMAYDYKGTVVSYANLPASKKSGDVYQIQTDDAAHDILAGDWVVWSGSAWQKMDGSITGSEITGIVDSITVGV